MNQLSSTSAQQTSVCNYIRRYSNTTFMVKPQYIYIYIYIYWPLNILAAIATAWQENRLIFHKCILCTISQMGQEIVQAFARSIWDYNNLQETLGNLIKRKGRQKEKQSTTNAVYKLLECNKSYKSKLYIDSNTYMHILATNLDSFCSYFPPTTSM